MRFNFCLISGLFCAVHAAPACPAEVIKALGAVRFLEYIVINCMVDENTDLTLLGLDPPGASSCLVKFMSEHESLLPRTGPCREAIQQVVDKLVAVDDIDFTVHVAYEPATGELFLTQDFAGRSNGVKIITDVLQDFQVANDVAIYYPGCTAKQVLQRAGAVFYEQTVCTQATGSGEPDYTGLDNYTARDCYFRFRSYLRDNALFIGGSTTPLGYVCLEDPYGDDCVLSTDMQYALHYFENCAGYDIRFQGPVCSEEDVAAIEAFNPSPYRAFMECAFDGGNFCDHVDTYLARMAVKSSADCGDCYGTFWENVVVDDEAKSFCANGNYFTPECIASQGAPLFAFSACAGKPMITTKN